MNDLIPPLTRAVNRALVYIHFTGSMPGRLHSATWHGAFMRVEFDHARNRYRLPNDLLLTLEQTRYFKACQLLIAKGFLPRSGQGRSRIARRIDFWHPSADKEHRLPGGVSVPAEATAHDSGYWSHDTPTRWRGCRGRCSNGPDPVQGPQLPQE